MASKTEIQTNAWLDGPWTKDYEFVKNLGDGGQGYTYLAKKNKVEFAIKILKVDRDKRKSRRRMGREVHALSLLAQTAACVPNFIESNIEDALNNGSVRPFVSMEFIEGNTLQNHIKANGPLQLEDAIGLTLKISNTIEIAHSENTTHRDIKPDNIILRDGDLEKPVVIDFGLSFNSIIDKDDGLTWIRESVGNRFLTLPEMEAAGSSFKQEDVSDVTQLAGIFFYLLTKQYPEYLSVDTSPHERHRDILKDKLSNDFTYVESFFDRAFQHDFTRRLKTIGEFKERLFRVKNQVTGELSDINPLSAAVELKEELETRSRRYQVKKIAEKNQNCFTELKRYVSTLSKHGDTSHLSITLADSKPSGAWESNSEFLPISSPCFAVHSREFFKGQGFCKYFAILQGSEVTIGFQKVFVREKRNALMMLNTVFDDAETETLISFYDMSNADRSFLQKHFQNWFADTLNEVKQSPVN